MKPEPITPERRRWRWTLVLFAGFAGLVLAQRPASRTCESCSLPGLLMGLEPAGPSVASPMPAPDRLTGWTDLARGHATGRGIGR